ncbi:SMI1/KNR4 family protein (plasmid) [Sorangium sp. So ce119]|uniref:SMI1/KNR4 family protein n=1 Tax=Sorangium sp. So ce119 TaxID=3133279 RepID=UPI003F615077
MPSKISRAVESAREAGFLVRTGVPANDEQVAALQAAVGCAFPADYMAFLREFGALKVEDEDGELASLYVYGHAPGDELDLVAATQTLQPEFAQWGRDARTVAPFYSMFELPDDCAVFAADGSTQTFRRGSVEEDPRTFDAYVSEQLEGHIKPLLKARELRRFRQGYLGALRALLPDELVVPTAESADEIVIRRPRDGVLIQIRFGDGREYDGEAPGVFVFWTEPVPRSLEAMNEWNARAHFVRGVAQGDRNRYRGRLPARGLEPKRLLFALAHDADLPLPAPPASPTLDEVADVLTWVAKPRKGAPPLAREGSEILLSARASMFSSSPSLPLRVGVNGAGLIRARHIVESDKPLADLLFLAAVCNGRDRKDGDANADMERFTRAVVDGRRVELSFTTPLAALSPEITGVLRRELERDVDGTGLRRAPDESLGSLLPGEAPRVDRKEAELEARADHAGGEQGPVTRALMASLPWDGSSVTALLSSASRASIDTPWGQVRLFLRVRDVSLRGYTPVEIGFVRADAPLSDGCRIVGVRDKKAVLLAADLRSFISVMVLGTTGFGFDGDDARVWRNYRDRVADDLGGGVLYFRQSDALCRAVGVTPATSVGAVLAQAAQANPGARR